MHPILAISAAASLLCTSLLAATLITPSWSLPEISPQAQALQTAVVVQASIPLDTPPQAHAFTAYGQDGARAVRVPLPDLRTCLGYAQSFVRQEARSQTWTQFACTNTHTHQRLVLS